MHFCNVNSVNWGLHQDRKDIVISANYVQTQTNHALARATFPGFPLVTCFVACDLCFSRVFTGYDWLVALILLVSK